MFGRRLAPLVVLAAAALLVMGAMPADAQARRARIRLALPSPGHVTISEFHVIVRGHPRGVTLRKQLRLSISRAGLTSSIGVLWAKRRVHKGRTTKYVVALAAFNRGGTGGSRRAFAAQAGAKKKEVDELDWLGALLVVFDDDLPANEVDYDDGDECDRCELDGASVPNADTKPKGKVDHLAELFRNDLPSGTSPGVVTGHAGPAVAGTTTSEERVSWTHLSQAITREDIAPVVQKVEIDLVEDLNGDGRVGDENDRCMRSAAAQFGSPCPAPGTPSGAPTGSGRLARDCSDPDCPYMAAFVKSDQPLSTFEVELPAGYSVVGAGGAFVNGNQVGQCSGRNARFGCGVPEQPAGTEIKAVFATGDANSGLYKRLPDGIGADLYLTAPKTGGPFRLTGP
jgi:hypothetical protein